MLRITQIFHHCGFLVAAALGLFITQHARSAESDSTDVLVKALTLYASFNKGVNADFAKGDARLFTRVQTQPTRGVREGLQTQGATRLVSGQGLNGNGLQFTKRNAPWIFFKGHKNVSYEQKDWSGTVSVWLRLDPETDLDPGYCDPIQLTTRAWNDAAFFVDFDKEGDPRDFRLGAFADLQVWNPENKEIPEDQRPLHKVHNPPFDRNEWTHVVFTWEKFNTGAKDGIAILYLNGKKQGTVTGWNQIFSWKSDEESRLYLGLNYIGFFDELSCFDRALSGGEIQTLFGLENDVLSNL